MTAPAIARRRSTHRAIHVFERSLLVYRRTWRGGLFTTFLAPVLFLAAMGLGLGTFVNSADPSVLHGVPYLVFLAPGLLVSQAMQTGAGESMYPVLAGFMWERAYVAMITTPVRARDVVGGHVMWLTFRLSLVSIAFIVVMILFGATDVARGIAILPVAVLTGLAFAAPISAFSATQRRDDVFALVNRFIVVPLFIFSGTFFPITQLPWFLQLIAFGTPLWHGVSLARMITLGEIDPVLAAVNLVVICGYIAVGVAACLYTFRRRLIQ